MARRGQLRPEAEFHQLQTKAGCRTVCGETCFDVKWTILDPNTLRKTGANALSADRAANALQMLGAVPELAALVEAWFMIPDEAKATVLQQASSIQIGVRE